MVRSGNRSPTLTELNSRSAIAEATFSIFLTTPGERRVRLLYDGAVLVGDDVLGDDDVGAMGLTNRVKVDIAVELVAGLNRALERQLLVDLDDLLVHDADIGIGEERR